MILYIKFISIFSFVTTLILTFLVYKKQPKFKNYILLNGLIAFWSLCFYFWMLPVSKELFFLFARLLLLSIIFMPYFFYKFCYEVVNQKLNPILNKIGFICILIFSILTFTNLLISNVKPIMEFNFWPRVGILLPFFQTYYVIYFLIGLKILFKNINSNVKVKYYFLATFVGLFFSITTWLPWYDINFFPIGIAAPLLYVAITYFAIVKHRLLDFEFVISKFLTNIIILILFICVYTLLYHLYNSNFFYRIHAQNQLGLMLFIGIPMWIFIKYFSKINQKIQAVPDSVLLKDFFNIPETSKYFSEKMGKAIDLIEFFRTVEDIFLNIVGCSSVKVYLREDFQTGKSESVENYFLVNQSDARMNSNSFLSINNPLIQKGLLNAKAIVYDEEDFILQSELEKLDSKIFIPCLVSQGEILGIVYLSGKLLNRPFTNNDLTFFDLMTTELGIILDRILAYSNNLILSLNLEKTQKSLMVTQFINEYIHEIKTPLTALEGFATAEDLSVNELNKIVLEQTTRIKNLLTNILKIANNQRIRDIKLVNINQIIESVLGLFTDMGKKIREFDSHLPYMYGDYEDLQIVFTNMIKNSREAMFSVSRDKRQLTIQTKYLITTNEIEISVTDTGPGISEDKLQSIWKRFQTTKLNDGGSGLGLSIVKRIVAEHQGSVNVTSKVGFETTFQIIFNLTENKKEYEKGLSEKDWRIA